ncbi:uncharacterized protein [Ptychodera flava]|uniref:uncharacterized protein n=1 Tax=Ptychodera flava TaxID=63121 RepID=UPI003969F659
MMFCGRNCRYLKDDLELFEDFEPPEKAEHILGQWIEAQKGSYNLLFSSLGKIGLSGVATKVKKMIEDTQERSPNLLDEVASTTVTLLQEDNFGELWKALNISDDDVELYDDFEPTEKAREILKLWLQDNGITALDRLLHCLEEIGLGNAAKAVRSKVEEIVAFGINEEVAQMLWLRLEIRKV